VILPMPIQTAGGLASFTSTAETGDYWKTSLLCLPRCASFNGQYKGDSEPATLL